MPGLGSVVNTESNQSSENRNIGASAEDSREEERQRTGLFRWDDPVNLMPSWSVPPGLIVPGPRHPEADAQPAGPDARPPGSAPQPDAEEPASDDSPWPGAAPPAGWFLRAASPPDARQESAPARETEGDQPAQPFASPAPAAPSSPWPGASAVPSPTRERDGSWSSPLTPKPARRRLGPTQARYGRAGGPGFQPTRSGQPPRKARAPITPAFPRGNALTGSGPKPASSGSGAPPRRCLTCARRPRGPRARGPRARARPHRRRRHGCSRNRRSSWPHRNGTALMIPRAGPGGCRSRWARRCIPAPPSTKTTAPPRRTGGATTGRPSGNVRPAWCPRLTRTTRTCWSRCPAATPCCSITGCQAPGGPATARAAAAP